MKKITRLFALIMAIACIGSLVACNNSSNSTTTGDNATDSKGTIAVVAKGETHAFWQAVKAGAEAAGQSTATRLLSAVPQLKAKNT